jgi:hypothetical protein
MKSMFTLIDVPSWVEDFDSSTKDAASREATCSNFLLLPELEDSVRQVLDRVHRRHGRGFLITGLYGSGKTLFMAYLSAILSEPVLLKRLLDTKPEWALDDLVRRKYLTVNFTAIANQDQSLEESLWAAVDKTLRSLSPPVIATISDVSNFLETFELWGEGSRRDVEDWLKERSGKDLAQLKTYDPAYQKAQLEQAMASLGMKLDERKTTLAEKVQILISKAKDRGYEGVAVFIDELYLHLIQSDETFNKDTAFLSQLAQAGMVEDRPFWVFAAMQEEIQAIARQAGRNYNTELMGRLAGQAGRFQGINLPVTQFHRIYNHRLFKGKKIHKLAELFRTDIQPHYRGSFLDFFRRYFRTTQSVTDEAVHFAEVYPMHPYAMHCLTKITNSGGRSRGALGFVEEFCHKAVGDERPWYSIATLTDVFNYEDLRNKIIQDNPDIHRFYGLFERFCTGARDEVLNRAPYRKWDEQKRDFVLTTSEALVKALIVLAMVKEELTVSQLNDALMLRWPEHENDPAGSDEHTIKLLEKIAEAFPPLRKKGKDASLTFFLSVEGDGGERDALKTEIERIINGQDATLERDTAYRAQLGLYLQQAGPLGGSTPPPQPNLKSELSVTWQRTQRKAVYMLEAAHSMTAEATVSTFLREVGRTECLHLIMLYPSAAPLDVEMDKVSAGDGRVLVWLPATLQAQDVDDLRRSMALVRLHSDYLAKVTATQAPLSDQRKLEIIAEGLALQTARSNAQPSPQAKAALRRAFLNGRVYRWSPEDRAWEELFNPGQLLSLINGIPEADQSLAAVVEKLVEATLAKEHALHPNFQQCFNFSADLSAAMQRRLLQAIWKGRVTEDDGSAKKDLEKYLGPLGLLDTSRPSEVVVTIGASSEECFRKIRERVRDRIRKSSADPQEISVPDLRNDLKAKDTGLTDAWIDIALTILLSLGDVCGITTDDKTVSTDNKQIGEPRDWLLTLAKLRGGSKPDDALWKDVVRSLQALGHWEHGTAYTPMAADLLQEVVFRIGTEANAELQQAQELLATWPTASVPKAVDEQVDIFNIAPEKRPNKTSCMESIRDALRDVVGLPADTDVDRPDRYQVVKDWALTLREGRDFLQRAEQLGAIAFRLTQLAQAKLPSQLTSALADLLAAINKYIESGGTSGSLSEIKGLWQDFQSDFRSQYESEHAGVNSQLRNLRDNVIHGDEYTALTNLSMVTGLSAHFNPERIQSQLASFLTNLGMTDLCEPTVANLGHDLAVGWKCSVCSYSIGTLAPFSAESVLSNIRRGLDEYLSHVRGFGDSIRDYVSDHPEATALVQLLEDPLPADALSVVADPALRGHLGSALENAKATRIDIDHVLADLKPRLLGLYRNGVTDFRAKLVAEVEHLILTEADDGQPWKVE